MGAALAIVIGTLLLLTSTASAHVELAESEPANITTVTGPLSEVRLTFSGAADPVEDEFSIAGQDGSDIPIASIQNDGDTVLVVRTTEPVVAGRTRMTWAIRSGDSHTMTGALSFTVESASDPAAAPAPSLPAPTAEELAAVLDTSAGQAPEKGLADHLASAARWLVYGALLVCVGGLGYLAWVHRGTAGEGRRLVFYIRRAALVVAAGAVVEWLAQVYLVNGDRLGALWSPSAWGEVVGSSFAGGTALRLVGAGLVLVFLRIDLDHGFVLDRSPEFDFRELTGEWPGRDTAVATAQPEAAPLARLRVEASPLALVGAVLLIASESFIGHTSSVQPRFAVLASDAGHLVAGGLWAAGTFMLALTLWGRRRRGEPLDARLLGTRFSVMAGWSLVGVAATGLILGWAILGEVSALWSTEFGRLLSAKVAVVIVIAAIGAHNHRVLVPALGGKSPDVDERFRRTVTAEAVLFAAVLVLTALLVVSNPT